MSSDKKLNLIAPVGKTGYGVTGYNILKTLVEREWDVSLFLKGQHYDRSGSERQMVEFAARNSTYFPYNAPCLSIWHQFDLAMKVGNGKYYAWPIFELDSFNETEIHNLCYPDKLIVCSTWAKEIVSSIYKYKYDGDIHPIHNKDWMDARIEENIKVVPLGIDTSIFNTRYMRKEKNKNTIFLNIGKWEVRKGHDILVDIFNSAFTPEDNVELWLVPTNVFLTEQDNKNWQNLYMDSPLGLANKIKIIPWQDSHSEIANIIAMSDCGIFPSRAEGWNLELLEMMAMGKPVITTNYSAHTEFCNNDNSLLVDINELEPAYDGKWFFEQGHWAEIGDMQIEGFMEHMRYVHSKCHSPGSFINDAGIETGKKFTWDHSVDLLEKYLLDK